MKKQIKNKVKLFVKKYKIEDVTYLSLKNAASEMGYTIIEFNHITNEKNVALTVFSADCVPILFLDPKNKAIGAAHCGWRGTFKKLAPKMIKELKRLYGSKPEDILTAICPAIKSCCYEVSKDLYDDFILKFPFLENSECAIEKCDGYYLDLPLINITLL